MGSRGALTTSYHQTSHVYAQTPDPTTSDWHFNRLKKIPPPPAQHRSVFSAVSPQPKPRGHLSPASTRPTAHDQVNLATQLAAQSTRVAGEVAQHDVEQSAQHTHHLETQALIRQLEIRTHRTALADWGMQRSMSEQFAAEEQAKCKAAEEVARKARERAAEEEARQKAAEAAAQRAQRAATEEALRKEAEEEAQRAQRAAEDEALRKAAEEEALRAKQRAAEDVAPHKVAEAAAQRAAQRAAEEEALLKAAEAAAQRAAQRAADEEALFKAAEAAAQRAAQRAADEEALLKAADNSASDAVSVVVGPMEVRDVSKANEFITALRAVKDGTLSEGRVSEYDVYVTNSAGVVCNDVSSPVLRETGPYFLREIYPTKAAQDSHGKDSEALAAFRAVKGELANFKNPDRAVDIPRATVTEGKVVSEEEFLAQGHKQAVEKVAAAQQAKQRAAEEEAQREADEEARCKVVEEEVRLEVRAGLTLPEATTVSDPAVESKLNANKMHNLREAQMNAMLGAFDAVDPDETEFAPRLDLHKEIEKHVADCAQVQQLVDHVRNLDCMVVEKDDFEEIVQMWVDGTLKDN